MARMRGRRRSGESVSGYFRKIFVAQPELLDGSSNAVLLERWKADHGATQVPDSVRSNLANLKSQLRKRRLAGLPLAVRPITLDLAPPLETPVNGGLEALEEQIDESLIMARTLDREGLDEVIHLLRQARNKVVCKLGE